MRDVKLLGQYLFSVLIQYVKIVLVGGTYNVRFAKEPVKGDVLTAKTERFGAWDAMEEGTLIVSIAKGDLLMLNATNVKVVGLLMHFVIFAREKAIISFLTNNSLLKRSLMKSYKTYGIL